ncbi:MAG: histidine kinase, partial [Rhodospirillaceae bacterium]|nr:histidine kinase [Rhodospirillaceae bacterium]
EMQRPTVQAEGLHLTLDLADGEPIIVSGVDDRLVQVFQNLLSNAQSFSPQGGEIKIRVARAGGDIHIDVEDQGPGVAEDLYEAIFDRFHTFRPKDESFGAHSGLGLSISRQIINAHGGAIYCRNRQAPDGSVSGACFTIRLPEGDAGA